MYNVTWLEDAQITFQLKIIGVHSFPYIVCKFGWVDGLLDMVQGVREKIKTNIWKIRKIK